ncbi:MAG: hypothetical protein VCC67_18330 [Myxococcota bacterium]
MSEAPLSPVDRRRNLVAVNAAMTATSLSYGLSVPLLSSILADLGAASAFFGVLWAAAAVLGPQLGGLA